MEEKQLTASTPEAMTEVAGTILKEFPQQRVFALFGKMGAGKTTLIKAFAKALGVSDTVSSPTFSLVNEYTTENGDPVFHFDFYRIETIEEVYDIGFEEYIYSGEYCFMEWTEKILELLPESYVYISVDEKEDRNRIITYKEINR